MRALTLASLLLLPLLASADVPRRMTWHGRLARADGSPETNPQTLKFALYAAASGGVAVWEETLPSVPVVNGAYAVVLGLASPLPLDVVNGQDLYLGLSLNGGAELQPRVRVASVPYSLTAADAHALQGHAATDFALTSHSHANATASAAGFMSAGDKSKLDGLSSGSYASASHGHSDATASSAGFMSASDKTKLDGLDSGKPYASASHTHTNASNTTAGFMSPGDKTKLDGIETFAFATFATAAHTHTPASCSSGASSSSNCTDGFLAKADKFKLDKYPAQPPSPATTSTDGLMGKADKAKLDNLALACSYLMAEAAGDSTATAKCASADVLAGSTCAILDGSTLVSGAEPVNVTPATANAASTGPGVRCAGNGDATKQVHAWVYCCSL